MVDLLSPLQPVLRPGSHGNFADGVGVVLSEVQPGSIVQAAAWPGRERAVIAAIKDVSGLSLPDGAGGGVVRDGISAYGFAPGKFLILGDEERLADKLTQAIASDDGTAIDLTHGRTVIGVSGSKAEWVLAKFFAIDFSLPVIPVGCGISTNHHDIFAQIQRSGAEQFDVTVFRSFARAFWTSLCHASEEVGYEVR
jgi:heterotetrameric sarcosine oxidase gamma subunit